MLLCPTLGLRSRSVALRPRLARLAGLLTLVAACHAGGAGGGRGTAAPATAGAPAPRSAPDPFAGLDLGFERDRASSGWVLDRTDYVVTLDDAVAFEGTHSLALAHDGRHRGGRVQLALPLDAVRGHRVQARARVRTRGVTRGGAGLMLVADRGIDTLARRQSPGPARVRGDSEWTVIELALDVPADADEALVVLDHAGNGTAWFDGIELSVDETSTPLPARVEGTVVDATGKPVPGATLMVFSMLGERTPLLTDAEGRFSTQLAAGPYMVGAGAEAGVTATMIETAPGTNPSLELRLERGPQVVRGVVRDDAGAPFPGAIAMVVTAEELVFPTRTDAEGRFTVTAPAGPLVMVAFEGPDGQSVMQPIADPQAEVSAVLPRTSGASPAALEWIGKHHVPLRTVEPGSGTGDLAGLDAAFAGARVVGLGEATHGTREFFQLKHRLLEYLVERHGYTVFGLEASRAECRAIDRYVQTGEGDPRAALEGIHFWTWNTEEVLALVEWMRAYNATHDRKLHFVGFDVQTSETAASNVLAFLERVDPAASEREAVAPFAHPWNAETFAELGPSARGEVIAALDRLAARFARERKAWTAATSSVAFADAHEDAVQLQQYVRLIQANGDAVWTARDRAMADNVLHATERYGKGTKAVLWAHNGHISREWAELDVMGRFLSRALGQRYVAVGFAFDRGGFQANGMDGEEMTGLREHRVGSAKAGDFEAALRDGGPALFALPLRDLPKRGPAAQWLRAPRPMRQIGAAFIQDDLSARVIEPVPERFDVMVFVEETTRARPLGRR
jgi:erythromycin esterase